jgi:hypothetical protein
LITIEEDTRHQLMQHIIDSRGGAINKDSLSYGYLSMQKQIAEKMDGTDVVELLAKAKQDVKTN